MTEERVIFDLIGVDASIANSLRRIMLAEVPTVAIEMVYMRDNTSIIHDEVLAHRIGLVPMKIDPDLLEPFEETNEPNDLNTIVVGLEVRCKEDEIPPLDKDDEVTPGKAYTKDVLSGDLRWAPAGNQSETFNERGVEDVRPVHDDIVLTKLRPGQGVHFEAHCRRGVGKDHAKFSPSATASYRLLPEIRFENPVTGTLAQDLKAMCPVDVFDIEDIGGTPTAVAARPRNCTMCRECIRLEGWNDGSRVKLLRKADHFIFSVESTGALPAQRIVKEAIKVLRDKAGKFTEYVDDQIQMEE